MKIQVCLLISLSLLMSGPAAGQSRHEKETGSLISIPKRAGASDKKQSDEVRGRDMMNQFARCIVDRSSRGVAVAIALEPGSDDDAFNRTADDECLEQGRMTFSASVLRGAVFGELYRRLQKGDKNVTEKFPVRALDWSSPPSPGSSARVRTNFFMLWMSNCVFATKASAMQSVVLAPVGSPTQQAAYSAVIPALGPCVPAGEKLAFSRAMLEAAFGEYLYRSLVPAIPATAEKRP